MAIFNDTFTDTNGVTLQAHTPDTGTSWTRLFGDDGTTDWLINASNQIAAEAVANVGTIYTCDATYSSADYYIEWTAVGIGGTAVRKFYAFVRVQDQENMYAVQMAQPGTASASRLYKKVSGTWTALGTAFTTPANGSVCRLEISGTTLRFLDDGVQLDSVTVSDISAAGKAGIGAGGGAELVNAGDDHHSANIIDNLTVDVLATFKDGAAALAGSGSISPVGNVLILDAAALAGAGTVSPAGSLLILDAAALAGSGAVSPAGSLLILDAAGLAGSGAMVSAGKVLVSGQAVLASSGAISPAGSKDAAGSAVLAGTGTFSAVPRLFFVGAALLAGVGTLAGVAADLIKQLAYRWLNDDGSEAAATFAAGLNTGIAVPAGTAKRLRVQLGTLGNPASKQFQLEFRKVGDPGWTVLGTNGQYQQLTLGLRPADQLFAYWPVNELSGATAYDLGPNRFHGSHNANVVVGQAGPAAFRKCGWYDFLSGAPAYTELWTTANQNNGFGKDFPGSKGSFSIWCYAAAVITFENYLTSATGTTTTLIDSTLIGQLAGKTPSDWELMILDGTNAGQDRDVTGLDDATGTVTVSPAFSGVVDNNVHYHLFNKIDCHWNKNGGPGGRPFSIERGISANPSGILIQMEALNSKMTSNYVSWSGQAPPNATAEQQAFTQTFLFDYGIDPGWQHFVVTWDKAADQTFHWRNGVSMGFLPQQPMPMTGLGTWQYDLTAAQIGCYVKNGDRDTSKFWHGGICDLAIWRDVLTEAEVVALYNGGI